MNTNKKIIIIILISLIIIVGIAIGLYYYSKNNQKEETTNINTLTPAEITNKKAKLIIKTNPNNTRVTISGINSSFFEERIGSFEINVPAEKIYITAFLSYYQNLSQEIEIKEGETKNIEVNLTHKSLDITEGAPIEGFDSDSNDDSNNLIPNP